MIQTVCDKCGKVLTPKDTIFEVNMGVLRDSTDEYEQIEYYDSEQHYDFCADCFFEIRDILRGETTDVIKVDKNR